MVPLKRECIPCDHSLNPGLIKWGLGEGCRGADGVGVGTGSVCVQLNRFLWESSRSDSRGLRMTVLLHL